MRHFIDIRDHDADAVAELLDRSALMKRRKRAGVVDRQLAGKSLVMYFEKASLRTRLALDIAASSLGGAAVALEAKTPTAFWDRESVADQARVAGRMAELIAMRTYRHDTIREFARWADAPVVNALSDHSHPTQAMADLMTLREHFGRLRDLTLVFVGDGNNVARSLLEVCARTGMRFIHTGPKGYELPASDYESASAECPGSSAFYEADPVKAVAEADCLYTDVWTSMGQEEEEAKRREDFAPYRVDRSLVSAAPSRAVTMHCLPAVRGEEITDEILDDPERCLAFPQAENRMHFYRGLFPWLLENR